MAANTQNTEVTLLCAQAKAPDFAMTSSRIIARLARAGLAATRLHLDDPRATALAGDGFHLYLGFEPEPIGAEAFQDTIDPDATPAQRNALVGVILGHETRAHVTVCPDAPGVIDPLHLSIAHLAAAEMTRSLAPLGLIWGPTNRLLTREAYAQFLDDDAPMELFLRFRSERGPGRKLVEYRLAGAEAFLGQPLLIRAGNKSEEELRAAALGFVQWRLGEGAGPGLPREYRHGGTHFGIKPGRGGGPAALVPIPDVGTFYEKAS